MLFFLMLQLQLQSFSRRWMVFLTSPLALIGVVPALLIFNAPVGFVALLGVIALSGLIVGTMLTLVFLPALYAAWFRVTATMTERAPGTGAAKPAAAT
jgi:multidrug efflux pump subunit AcrB